MEMIGKVLREMGKLRIEEKYMNKNKRKLNLEICNFNLKLKFLRYLNLFYLVIGYNS